MLSNLRWYMMIKGVVLIGAYIPLSEEDLSTMKELDTALIGVDVENVVIMGNSNVSYSNLKKIFAIFPIFLFDRRNNIQ